MATVGLPDLGSGTRGDPRTEPAPPTAGGRDADYRPPAGSQMTVYLPWVDLLRFLACLLVIYSHAVLRDTPEQEVPDRVPFGYAGVGLFFSVSGFLIGTVLKNMYGQPGWYARFYVNRFLRIYPPLLVGLTVFGILAALGFAHRPGTLQAFLRNVVYMLTFTQQLSPDKWIPYGIVWTLCIEEWFYLLLPAIVLAAGPRRTLWVLVGLIALTTAPALERVPGTEVGIWFVWPVNLLGGAVLALADVPRRSGFPWIGLAGLVFLVANAAADRYHAFGPVVGAVTTVTVWSFATTTTRFPRALDWGRFAGKRSYGIYLLHIAPVSVGVRLAPWVVGQTTGPWFDLVACTVAAALSVLGAAVMWAWFEVPVLNFRKRVHRYPVLYRAFLAMQLGLVPAGLAYWLLAG